MAVEVLPTGATPTGQQRVLFSATGYMSDPLHKSYDVSPDGRRFVMIRAGDAWEGAAAQLIVVENFFEELRRLGKS